MAAGRARSGKALHEQRRRARLVALAHAILAGYVRARRMAAGWLVERLRAEPAPRRRHRSRMKALEAALR